jgi:hypothetical protein
MGSGRKGHLGGLERLALVGRWLSLVALVAGLASADGAAAQTGSIGGAIGSAQGTATVVHSDGRAEAARSGMPVVAGDRIETGLGGAASVTYNDGSTLALNASTTVDLTKSESGSNGILLLTASQSRGVTVSQVGAGKDAEIRILSTAAGVGALLKQGGMAVRTDENTNTVTLACETAQSRVYFPYEDLRVPCEQRIVRTYTTDGDIVDTGQGNQPGMVAVFESVQDGKANGIDPNGQNEQRTQKDGERRENRKEDHDNTAGSGGLQQPGQPGQPGLPSFSITGRCVNITGDGASCNLTATGVATGRVGGVPTVTIQTLRAGGGTTSETFSCTAISASFGFTCVFGATGQVFQGSSVTITVPLAAVGTQTFNFFINCDFFRPPGVAC